MSIEDKEKPVADDVLWSIKRGEVKKLPRRYFVVRSLANVVLAAIAALLLFHISGLIMFALHRHGALYAPSFGWRGWLAALGALPLDLIIYAAIFAIVLIVITRRYPLVYRRPLLISGLTIGLVAIAAGYLFAKSHFHAKLLNKAAQIPVIGRLYQHHRDHRLQNLHRGIVVEVIQQGLVVRENDADSVTVLFTTETRFPDGSVFSVDDEVFVLGPRDNDTIQAVGIHRIEK